MTLRSILLIAWLPLGAAYAAKVNIVERAINDVDGSIIDALSQNQFIDIGNTHTTVTAPVSWSSYRFTHWTFDGEPAMVFRDLWERSITPISFQVSIAATATAHYLPATRDSDSDSLPDWYEIEHFGTLDHGASSDTDGDGITLLAEYTGNTSPLYANASQAGGVAWVDSALVTCNLAGYPTYVLRSDPAGTVNQSATVPQGTVVTTTDLAETTSFGYWTLDGVRQADLWGRALSVLTFTMGSQNREAVAWIFSGDSDSDSVPDAYEQRMYGTLDHNGSSDTDGDGITLLAEYTGNTSPLYANTTQSGGVVWVDSGTVTCNLAGYPAYVLRSSPVGTVNQSATVPPGTVVTVPDLSGNSTFAYWTLDGVRQDDAWGRSVTSLSFTMASADREAVAYMITGDSDGDGVPDAYEQRYYGNLSNNGTSDTDGDGINLLAEYTAGSSPVYANNLQEGGVAWADSSLVTADLQAEIAVEQPAGSDVSDGGTRAFGTAVVGGTTSLTFTISNAGGTPLTGLAVTLSGADASLFSVTQQPTAPLTHNATTSFTVQFAPLAPGSKSVNLQIASNDANENPFDLTLTVQAVLSYTVDTDGDGMNDASEFQMATLGFDWQVKQTALVTTYFTNAHLNNLFTPAEVQALRVAPPTLTRDAQSGLFKLTLKLEKSTDRIHFNPLPLAAPQSTLNAQGDLEFLFSPPDDAAFFRLESE